MGKINPTIEFYMPIIRIPSLKVGGFPSPTKRDNRTTMAHIPIYQLRGISIRRYGKKRPHKHMSSWIFFLQTFETQNIPGDIAAIWPEYICMNIKKYYIINYLQLFTSKKLSMRIHTYTITKDQSIHWLSEVATFLFCPGSHHRSPQSPQVTTGHIITR